MIKPIIYQSLFDQCRIETLYRWEGDAMVDTGQMSLGRRLQRERESYHWTQEQLAEKIGGSVPSINRWEHDRATPRQDMFRLLSEVFGRPPERWGTGRQVLWNI